MNNADAMGHAPSAQPPLWWGAALIAVACLVSAPFVSSAVLAQGLLITGGIGLVFATAHCLMEMRVGRLIDAEQRIAEALIADASAPRFVTDSGLRVVASNTAASERYEIAQERRLCHVLSQVFADPEPAVRAVMKRAVADQWGEVEVPTLSQTYVVALKRLSANCLVWEVRASDPAQAVGDADAPLLMFSVANNGAVSGMSPALAMRFERPVKMLSDILVGNDLQSGTLQVFDTDHGARDFTVVTASLVDGMTQVVLLPVLNLRQNPPQLDADWDAIEDLPVPLLKVAHDGRVTASNREARQLLGIARSKSVHLSDVLDGPGRPITDWLAQAVGGQGAHVSEFLRGRKDRRDTFVQVTLSTAGHGDEAHLIAVLNDVTELKTLEAQFVQSQKMQAIGQLAGGVAHDFNNLLTAISGHCDLLLLRHDEGHQNYADLIQIHQNANRAASLVGQLLAFSRKQTLQFDLIDLRDTLSDLTHLLNRLVGEKVTLTLDHEAVLAPIRADKRQLEQVLMNLVVNARDAMDGAGEIRVVTNNMTLASQMRKDRVVVPPGDYVVVNVIDEGSGIPPDKLQKIFEPFWTTKRTGEGTGLGLSTAYGIVKQTGGYIFAESIVGKGTTFSLLFPQYDGGAELPVTVPRMSARPQLGGKGDGVVLLVEDEAPVRAFASRALRMKGYTVLEADSAEAALALLDADDLHVDLFVSDVIMPGLDGPTWVREALKSRPDTHVVFVSGYPEDAFDDGEAPIPNAVFLPKPFSLTALTQTVQGQLQA